MTVVLARVVILFVILNIGMRIMGKRQIGEIQLTEFVSAVMLSELALLPITDTDIPLIYGVAGVFTLVSLEVISAFLCKKSAAVRRIMEGRPMVLICGGHIIEENLVKARVSTDELFSAIRGAGLRGPEEASYVILEQSGTLSVIAAAGAAPPTADDMGVRLKDKGISHPLIIDGLLQERTLGSTGKDKEWLHAQLEAKGLRPDELLYFCIDDRGTVSYERSKKK